MSERKPWKLVAVCVMAAALLILFWQGKPNPLTETTDNRKAKAVESRAGDDSAAREDDGIPAGKRADREELSRAPGRSKGALLQEAQRVFGQAEAARAKKLAEHFNETEGTYIYAVEPPTKEEVGMVQSQIADLLKEVEPGDRADFDKMLKEEIDSYDPYGETGRKVMMIMVPIEGPMRMKGMVIDPPDDPEAFQKSFTEGESYPMNIRHGWFASEDRKTLERFGQIMVWDPEGKE